MTEYSQQPSTPVDILSEEDILLNQYQYASTGQRFLNYLIDNLFMNYGLSYLTGYAVGIMIGTLFPDFAAGFQENRLSLTLVSLIVSILNYILYYTLCEKLFNGYTLGKLITGTRAIREDGKPLTFRNALLRSLSRLVPFEVFSGFQIRPWHDQWTGTMVVKPR